MQRVPGCARSPGATNDSIPSNGFGVTSFNCRLPVLAITNLLHPATLTGVPFDIPMKLSIRLAIPEDVSALSALIDASVRGLQSGDYTPRQIEGALASVYGVDTQLIADGTYYAVEGQAENAHPVIAGCGGWSRRKTLYGGDQWGT